MNPLPSPNMSPKPMTQKAMEETANTMKFFERMFVEFFTRQKPVSTHPKPRFMKNTSIAGINTQSVSATTFGSMLPSFNDDTSYGARQGDVTCVSELNPAPSLTNDGRLVPTHTVDSPIEPL